MIINFQFTFARVKVLIATHAIASTVITANLCVHRSNTFHRRIEGKQGVLIQQELPLKYKYYLFGTVEFKSTQCIAMDISINVRARVLVPVL